MAGGFVSLLVWIAARSAGVPRRRLKRHLLWLWLGMIGCVGVLAVARWQVGGEIMDYDGHRYGLIVRSLAPRQVIWVALAALYAVVFLVVAVRMTRRLTAGAASLAPGPPDDGAGGDRSPG